MFTASLTVPAYKNLLGWRQHTTVAEFQIDIPLTVTESGEYYQQKHPALRLDIIKATLPDGLDLSDYLETKVRDASIEMFNDLIQYRQLKGYGKTLLSQAQLLNKYGWLNDKITNENRFVGYQIRMNSVTGLQATINQIGFQFSGVESFDLYLFHSSKKLPIKTISVTTTGGGDWDWILANEIIAGFSMNKTYEGVYVLGYYQQDITTNAINGTGFNFDKGDCSSCNSQLGENWRNISEHFMIYPIYVPNGSYVKGEMFDLNDAFHPNDKTYGLNLRLSVECNLTEFFIDNKFAFKNLLALKVTDMILKDMKFSQEINFIEENIKMMIIRDLEGDVETKLTNISSQYQKELQSVEYNISEINSKCLSCERAEKDVTYGFV
jgi:hypothetical protein